jgi:RNA polymerase sigma-70 factor (ECF subfamily)
LDAKKKAGRKPTDQLEDSWVEAGAQSTIVEPEDPAESVERSEREEILQKGIEALPEHQRAMIVMFHVESLSYEDIAATLDLPIGTVKSRLNRARLALREILEPYEELLNPA